MMAEVKILVALPGRFAVVPLRTGYPSAIAHVTSRPWHRSLILP